MTPRPITSPYERQKRHSFTLRLGTGQTKAFKDAWHRGRAVEAISRERFASWVEYVDFIKGLPNGFDSFLPEE